MLLFLRSDDIRFEGTREYTPSGMLRADVVVTRTGVFQYDAGELGVGDARKDCDR